MTIAISLAYRLVADCILSTNHEVQPYQCAMITTPT